MSTRRSTSRSSSNNEELPVNLDPTVAALLGPYNNMTVHELRIQMAHMKLQQARVRGNSDYAAKIMDLAIEEGARDREVWTLLEKHMRQVEQHIATVSSTTSSSSCEEATEKSAATESSSDQVGTKATDSETESNAASAMDAAEKERLEGEVRAASERADGLESTLKQCLLDEISSIQAEQASIQEREERLRSRIRSLQTAIESSLPASSKDELEEALKVVHEQQCTLVKTECTICRENSATRAVIPCGHLCLCDSCTKTMTTNESSSSQFQRQCPLCRGHLLSTIPIYTTK